MTLKMLLSTLLILGVSGRYCLGASIGEGLAAEAVPTSIEKLSPADMETKQEDIEIVEPVAVADEMMRMEAEDPKTVQKLAAEEAPYNLNDEQFPVDILPVAEGEENCEKSQALVDEKSADRAERQANEDLLKALDTVLENKETLEDVMKSEDASIPLPPEKV